MISHKCLFLLRDYNSNELKTEHTLLAGPDATISSIFDEIIKHSKSEHIISIINGGHQKLLSNPNWIRSQKTIKEMIEERILSLARYQLKPFTYPLKIAYSIYIPGKADYIVNLSIFKGQNDLL